MKSAERDPAAAGSLRRLLALSLLLVVPLGFASRLDVGLAPAWARNAAGGVLYEVFWCLSIQLLLPRAEPRRIALAVLTGTCALELLQLWHPPFLEALRRSFPGRTLVGAAFDGWDFPAYVVGSALGWWWLRRLARRAAPR